jgi:hypothetical protein
MPDEEWVKALENGRRVTLALTAPEKLRSITSWYPALPILSPSFTPIIGIFMSENHWGKNAIAAIRRRANTRV